MLELRRTPFKGRIVRAPGTSSVLIEFRRLYGHFLFKACRLHGAFAQTTSIWPRNRDAHGENGDWPKPDGGGGRKDGEGGAGKAQETRMIGARWRGGRGVFCRCRVLLCWFVVLCGVMHGSGFRPWMGATGSGAGAWHRVLNNFEINF